jgi:hypothetical protein
MKLIRCKKCNDVVRLIESKWRTCECGKSGGQYNKDFMSATVGGDCEIIGISNLMFKKKYKKLSDEEKTEYKKKINHHPCEIWFGELLGDYQIIRIKSSKGPRLKAKVKWLKKASKITFIDKRDYSVNILGNKKPKSIVIEGNSKPKPSFKEKRDEAHKK